MAFTFNCTASDAAANSYVCEADANDFFDGDPRQSDWNGLTSTEKQQYLVHASNRLEMESWSGQITDDDQSLQWPRNFVADRDGGFHDETTVPQSLKVAVYELAFWYLQEITGVPLVSRNDMARMDAYSVGPLNVSMRKISENQLPDIVSRALRSIGADAWKTSGTIKLVR